VIAAEPILQPAHDGHHATDGRLVPKGGPGLPCQRRQRRAVLGDHLLVGRDHGPPRLQRRRDDL
jgi:hypothetical protein